MKNRMSIVGVLLLGAAPVFAQAPGTVRSRPPVAEMFGGFSYTRLSDSGTSTNTKGIVGSFAWNARPWLQLVADSSYNTGSYSGVNVTLYGNHYGARVFYRERNYRTSLFSGHQNNIWVSSGLGVRLGGASPE